MSVVGQKTFLGVTDETAITTGTSGTGDTLTIASVTGTTMHVDDNGTGSLAPVNGYPLARMNQAAAAQSNYIISVSATGTITWAFVITTPSAWTASAVNPVQIRSAAAITSSLIYAGTGAPGQVRLANAASTTINQSANGTLTNSHQYYVLYSVTVGTSGTARIRMWDLTGYSANTDITGTTPTWDSRTQNGGTDATSNYGTPNITALVHGSNSSSPTLGTMSMGLTVVDNTITTIAGPLAASVGGGGPVTTIWNGTSEVPAVRTIWNGTSEVASTLAIA